MSDLVFGVSASAPFEPNTVRRRGARRGIPPTSGSVPLATVERGADCVRVRRAAYGAGVPKPSVEDAIALLTDPSSKAAWGRARVGMAQMKPSATIGGLQLLAVERDKTELSAEDARALVHQAVDQIGGQMWFREHPRGLSPVNRDPYLIDEIWVPEDNLRTPE